MIVFTHRPGCLGWEFESQDRLLQGTAKTLTQSLDCAEHAARHHLSVLHGYAVLPQEARYQVDHVVCDDSLESRLAIA